MVANSTMVSGRIHYDGSSIGNEEISRDSSNSEEDFASPVPEWKDDGDYIIGGSLDEMENAYDIPRIPSTLEFVLTEEESDSDGQPHSSQSSLNYSYAADSASSARQNNFRRRLNNLADSGSIETNPLLESQLALSSSRSAILGKGRQRFMLMLGAIVLVMLSTHDNMKQSRQYYRQEYQISSDNIRREEIAFPLVSEQIHSEIGVTIHGATKIDQERNGLGHSNVELPKFYFKTDPAPRNQIRGSTGSNLAMARPQKPRPVFVPDTPLPDGGFKKPLERFVFDSQTYEAQRRRRGANDDASSSWKSWIASLVLISMLFDTGWKEYRRYRIASLPSSRDD